MKAGVSVSVGAAASIAADLAVLMSATYNGAHFWSVLRSGADERRARQFATLALALLHAGLAVQSLYLLALSGAVLAGRDASAFVGGPAAATRGPVLAGTALISALLIRDRIHNTRHGGER